jgi:hypothetical protein
MPKTTDRGRACLDLFSGSLVLWPARALFIGYAADTTVHAHHAVQICIAKSGAFRLRSDPSVPWQRFRAAVIAPDRSHQLDGGRSKLLVLYLDPESEEGRGLQAISTGDAFCSISSRHLTSALSHNIPADIDQGTRRYPGVNVNFLHDDRVRDRFCGMPVFNGTPCRIETAAPNHAGRSVSSATPSSR